jgi:hypothetical protein
LRKTTSASYHPFPLCSLKSLLEAANKKQHLPFSWDAHTMILWDCREFCRSEFTLLKNREGIFFRYTWKLPATEAFAELWSLCGHWLKAKAFGYTGSHQLHSVKHLPNPSQSSRTLASTDYSTVALSHTVHNAGLNMNSLSLVALSLLTVHSACTLHPH